MPSEQSTLAERSARHRAGVATQLRTVSGNVSLLPEMNSKIDQLGERMAAIEAKLAQGLDHAVDPKRDTRQ